MDKPTHEELCDVLESVHREADDSWRHGSIVHQVFKRPEDNTYWAATYRLSSDGETNELRDEDCDIVQVKPIEKTVVDYIAIGDE